MVYHIVDEFRPDLKAFEDIYRDIHQHPELGRQEQRTSGIAASHLKDAGYDVTTNIGGYGVVGVLKNGEGPTVLLRADMDALPVREETGLSYASTAETVDSDGEKKPVAHACGHDIHVSCLMGASTLLQKAKDKWKGTLVVLFQPDEEHGAGSRAMLDDKLYDRVPKPDVVLGQHLIPFKSGSVAIRSGVCMASADTFKITVYGEGAHGAQPQAAVDPIVLAASTILRLQTIVSREIGPEDVATVTCGTFHGGDAPNVIPNEAEFTLNVRTLDETVRTKVIAAIKRIVKAEAIASGAKKEPEVELLGSYPLTSNDAEATEKLEKAFETHFDYNHTLEAHQLTASEDFSHFATDIGVPSVYWNFGGVDPKVWEQNQTEKDPKPLPSPHQANYAPVIEPTLKTGVEAMSVAALTFLKVQS